MSIENEQLPLNISIGDQKLIAIKYWWIDNDFIFLTNDNQEYTCVNAYPTSISFRELDYTFTEETTMIETTQKYECTLERIDNVI